MAGKIQSYKADIWGSVIFKLLAIMCSFLLVPLMLKYLGVEVFGIWIAIFSIVSWVIFFDLGFASGLRNRLTESLARGDLKESSVLISTAYGAMAILSIFLYIIFFALNFLIDWQSIFNSHVVSMPELRLSMATIVLLFLINFTLLIVLQVLHACQKTSITVVHQFLANFFAFIVVLFMRYFVDSSLFAICLAYGLSQVVTTLIVSFVFYRANSLIVPRWGLFSVDRVKSIASLGGQFFIVQLAVLIIFSTDKVIIVKLFGPGSLTEYELVFKIFSSILIVNTLFLAPLWSRYTHAAENNDLLWMKKTLLRSNFIAVAMIFPAVILCWFGREIISLWSGYSMGADSKLLIAMLVFILLRVWTDIYAYFLNGVGVMKVQVWLAVLQAIINVPLSVYLGREFGVVGVVYGSILTLSLSGVLLPMSVFWYFKKQPKNELLCR